MSPSLVCGDDTVDVNDPHAYSMGRQTRPDLTNAEIQALLDAEPVCPGRTVKGILETVEAGRGVAECFYFGPNGPDGLMPEVRERYEYIWNMFKTDRRWWIENCATCGAPDNVCKGQEVHLYGLTQKKIECYVRCGTPNPPDFVLAMDDDEFDMVGLKDTIQTARLLAWVPCANRGCANAGTKKCGRCGERRYCRRECQAEHWRDGHREECEIICHLRAQAR